MTFDARHYVPILKAKQGEKQALSLLAAAVSSRLTPLLEIVERTDKPLVSHINTAFKLLPEAVASCGRCFIDAREIAPDGAAGAAAVFQRAEDDGITFTPVTGVSRTADVDAALEHSENGLALRLCRDDFESGSLGYSVLRFMDAHDLAPEGVDLIVDLGAVDEMVVEGVEAFAAAFLSDVPDHTSWKTFTLSASGFPPSMAGVTRNSHDLIARVDWLSWFRSQYANRALLTRLPTFSDGAIQNPKGVEGYNPQTMPRSAAIRYTLANDWLIVKGESVRNRPESQQYPGFAKELVYGGLNHYFAGPGHCTGCASIKDSADGAPSLGSAGVWRRLGTIHHVTTVVEQIDVLPWP